MNLGKHDKIITTDILVIGGGMAGCCAAIKIKEQGLDVTITDKALVGRSGSTHYSEGDFVNFNQALAQWWGVPSSWYQSMKKPDGWPEMLRASLTSVQPEPALMQKCVQALYDDETVIPLDYGTALWAITDNVQDSGVGLRGSSTQWNSQDVWLSK